MNKQMSNALAKGDNTPVALKGTQEFMDKEITRYRGWGRRRSKSSYR